MPSPFETLPRELRDQIYNEVLPTGKLILPAGHALDTAPGPNLASPSILTVNRSIYAEAVVRLYATNTISLLEPTTTTTTQAGGDEEARAAAAAAGQTAMMRFWRRFGGPVIQHVRVDLTYEAVFRYYCHPEGDIEPLLGNRVALWTWEAAALEEAVAPDYCLQTLTLDLNACTQDWSLETCGEARALAVMGLVRRLRGVIYPSEVTLHSYFRYWFKGGYDVTMVRRGDVRDVRHGGVVKHLVIRGLCDPTEGGEGAEVQRLCRDIWSMTLL